MTPGAIWIEAQEQKAKREETERKLRALADLRQRDLLAYKEEFEIIAGQQQVNVRELAAKFSKQIEVK